MRNKSGAGFPANFTIYRNLDEPKDSPPKPPSLPAGPTPMVGINFNSHQNKYEHDIDSLVPASYIIPTESWKGPPKETGGRPQARTSVVKSPKRRNLFSAGSTSSSDSNSNESLGDSDDNGNNSRSTDPPAADLPVTSVALPTETSTAVTIFVTGPAAPVLGKRKYSLVSAVGPARRQRITPLPKEGKGIPQIDSTSTAKAISSAEAFTPRLDKGKGIAQNDSISTGNITFDVEALISRLDKREGIAQSNSTNTVKAISGPEAIVPQLDKGKGITQKSLISTAKATPGGEAAPKDLTGTVATISNVDFVTPRPAKGKGIIRSVLVNEAEAWFNNSVGFKGSPDRMEGVLADGQVSGGPSPDKMEICSPDLTPIQKEGLRKRLEEFEEMKKKVGDLTLQNKQAEQKILEGKGKWESLEQQVKELTRKSEQWKDFAAERGRWEQRVKKLTEENNHWTKIRTGTANRIRPLAALLTVIGDNFHIDREKDEDYIHWKNVLRN